MREADGLVDVEMPGDYDGRTAMADADDVVNLA